MEIASLVVTDISSVMQFGQQNRCPSNDLCDYAPLGSSPTCPQFSSLKLCPTFSNPGRLKHHLNKTKTARETFLHYLIKISPLRAHVWI